MTANRRIFLNVVATYGRSLYAVVIGLLCGRWTLMSLGEVDYGLLGVVGGLIAFVSFANAVMANAVGRYYAFAVGEAQRAGFESDGLDRCRRWFNVALLIHTAMPIVLVAAGCPIGEWMARHYLVIPPGRIDACVWAWRFSCIACFVKMVSVPFRAMYTAKQEIAELTVYGFATTTLNACFLYYMVSHPGFWLVRFCAWSCLLAVVPDVLICIMAFVRFPECRLRVSHLWDVRRMKELAAYAGGRFLSAFSQLFCKQGLVVAVNKILGPARNAAVTVGNSVVEHASSLTVAMEGALYPAIVNAAGRRDDAEVRTLAYRACKLATVAALLFAAPLAVTVNELMAFWLKNPPSGAAQLCMLIFSARIVDPLTCGHWMAVLASGRVVAFNFCESVCFFAGFASAVVLMLQGVGVSAVGYGMVVGCVCATGVKLYFGWKLGRLSVGHWLTRILLPLSVAGVVPVLAGAVTRHFLDRTFGSVVVVAVVVELVFVPLAGLLVFDAEERQFVLLRLRDRIGFVKRALISGRGDGQ